MGTKSMVDKAKQLIEKQKELNYLVVEMKNEVKLVEQENMKLQVELETLKSHIKHKNISKSVTKQVLEVEKQKELPKDEQLMSVTKPVVASDQGSTIRDQEPRQRTQTQNSIIEFFLGKNVIVKIAAVLMVLAVISFGQIAYMDFLNDIGRFNLILSIGFVFIGLGYFFERKSADVFGNIFYILGFAVLLANNFLGLYEYQLYNDFVFMYLLIPLVVVPLLYFYKKRYKFLDTALNMYYLVIMFVPIVIFNDLEVNFHGFILITLIIAITGFAVYRNYTHNMDKHNELAIIEFIVLLIAAIAIIVTSSEIITTESISLAHMNVLMYQIFIVFIYYVIHFKNVENRNEATHIALLVTTTIIFFMLGSSLGGTFSALSGRDNSSISTLITVVLFIPIYVYMFKRKKDDKLTDIYLIIISGAALFFTFFVEGRRIRPNGNYYYHDLEAYLKNIILISEVMVLYAFSRVTKDKMQKFVSYGFMGITLFYTLIHFVLEDLSFSDFRFFVPTIMSGIVVYLLFTFVNSSHREKEEQDAVKLFALAVFIPFVLIFTKELLQDDAPVIIGVLVFYLIGIRYLFNLKLFKSIYQEEFTLGLNSLIVFLIFIANLFYFDHDFTQFTDLFKLLVVGLANVYLIQALREIGLYTYQKNKSAEFLFAVFYIVGVIIQAVFITQFINFDFDKVILSSYYMISAAVAILYGFRSNWFNVRKIGLFAIYFSLAKFFIYDLWTNDFDKYVRFLSYFILAVVLFGIAALYSYLEKTYGPKEEKLSE